MSMDALGKLLSLPDAETERAGLVYTPREIVQQPDTWASTRRRVGACVEEVQALLRRAGVGAEGERAPTVFLVGAGTSDYVGRSVAALLRREWRCDAWAVPSTDLLTSMDALVLAGRPYLWISFSRSGDSSEGVAVIEAALERHPSIYHLLVTCNEAGRMARDFGGRENVATVVLDDVVNDRGLAMTSSYSNMVVAGQCLAHVFDLARYDGVVERLASAARDFLPRAADAAASLVDEGFSKICCLGTGPLGGVATESALKVLELTAGRIVASSESFLGVRHGPLSSVDSQTLVVGFVSSSARLRAYEADLLDEIVRKRLAKRVVIVGENGGASWGEIDRADLLVHSACREEDDYRPPVDVIFGQLLGLFASLREGLRPDAPSPSGAISRVVEGVRIH